MQQPASQCTAEQSTAPAALFNNLIYFQTEFPNNVDIDLDEILDIEDENQRKKFIRVSNLILNCIFRFFTISDGCSNFSIYFKMSFCL